MEKIQLNEIKKEAKTLHEALGISQKKLLKHFVKIIEKYHGNLREIANYLRLQEDEIMGGIVYTDRVSEAIRWIWKNRGRKEITIEECVGTIALIAGFKEKALFFKELTKLLTKKGMKVKMFSPECIEWTKKHGFCDGCKCEFSCAKLNAIIETFRISNSYTPTSFFDYLSMQRWVADTVEKILKTTTIEELKRLFFLK